MLTDQNNKIQVPEGKVSEDRILIPQMIGKMARAFYQQNKHYRFLVFKGGRAGGKSESASQAATIRMAERKTKILCARQYQNSTDESVKASIEEWIDTLEPHHPGMKGFTIQNNGIFHENGSECLFWGLDRRIRALKSLKGVDICWVEEASDMRDDTMVKLLPTIRKPGHQFWFTYNPENDDDAVHKWFFVEDRYPEETLITEINYYDNPFVPQEMLDQAKADKLRNYEEYLHIWEGHTKYISDELIFNGCWEIGNPEPKEDTVFYYGMDFGFAKDPLAVIRCWIDEDRKELYIDQCYQGFQISLDDHARAINMVPGADRWPITADSARPEIIAFLNEPQRGFRVHSAIKGPNSVIEGIEFLKNYRIIVHERCEPVIKELATYSYKVDKRTGMILPVPDDKKSNDHFIDALRYATEGVRRSVVEWAIL